MSRSAKIAERFALLGAVASLVIALAGAVSLRERARVVDVITVVAGVVGAVVGLAAPVIRRRRAARVAASGAPPAAD